MKTLILGVAVAVLAVAACVHLGHMLGGQDIPADLDTSTRRPSAAGAFQVSYVPSVEPVPRNQLHAWTVHVETAGGAPVEGATIGIDGDMPGHGHGLPTRPRVTRELGGGDYLVEGIKFQMGGWWVMDLAIDAAGRRDTVRFNLMVPR